MADRQPGSVFFTPEDVAAREMRGLEPLQGRLLIASCRAASYLSCGVVRRYRELLAEEGSEGGVLHIEDIDFQFSDSETCVRLGRHVDGYDVFLFQALFDPTTDYTVDENAMAFLIAARAFREHGAKRVTAVLPYLAYARQDKPTRFRREPTTAKLMADLALTAGIDRLITWHPHVRQIHGFYGGVPVHLLEPLALFVQEFRRFEGRDDVIVVAPDAGAAKFVTHFGRALGLRSAVASKFRPRPEEAEITEVIGDFRGRRVAIVLDDIISSGGTVHALVKKLVQEKKIEEVHIGASHNLCTEVALDRLAGLHEEGCLQEVVVTNSIPQTESFCTLPFTAVRSLADVLSRVINRVHYHQSVTEWLETRVNGWVIRG